MQCAYRKMHSLEEGLEKGHIEKEEDRLCRDQRASIKKDIRIEGNNWNQQRTPMQWK